MKMDKPKYRIYPSLLIAFQNLLDYEIIVEEDWNKVTEAAHERGEYLDRDIGDYKLSPEEMYLKLEVDLLDSINRIDGEYSEAADMGTAFNEIVDCLIENRQSSRGDCKIYSRINDYGEKVITAEIHNFVFDFDINLCKQAAEYFKGSITQFRAESEIETSYGIVELYGFIDEWCGNKIYDIKTTKRYKWGKFEKGWQRHIYPWCVINSGLTTEIESFTYWVVEWAYRAAGTPLRAKNITSETYSYNHQDSEKKIVAILESFIEWLETRREFIQDKRIFGGENPVNWHGTPTDPEVLKERIFTNFIN